ncbi:hypothetical protein D3Z62_15360 [Lachnospiraceae bacterium]|nr:hypothetical protein [Lachnospiraceae bacterium]
MPGWRQNVIFAVTHNNNFTENLKIIHGFISRFFYDKVVIRQHSEQQEAGIMTETAVTRITIAAP